MMVKDYKTLSQINKNYYICVYLYNLQIMKK